MPDSDLNETADDILTCIVQEDEGGARLDKFLAERLEGLSRSRLKALILDEAVVLNDTICKDPSARVKAGAVVQVAVPAPVDDTPVPENIPLNILHEDEDMLVLNKPAGLVVHPGAGHRHGTLVNALLYHCGDSLSGIGGVRRPGIVHRLDKDTSGLMLVAKTDAAHQALSAQLADRTLGRRYKALVWGVPQPHAGRIDQPIGRHPSNRLKMAVNRKNGRSAATNYRAEETYGETTALVDCALESGRTHQVRVHMAYIRHPLIGDPLYGLPQTGVVALLKKGGYTPETARAILAFPRQALHAWRLQFTHPRTENVMSFEVDLPDDMVDLLKSIKSKP